MSGKSRSAARLKAVQALYQHEMEGTPLAPLLHQFHEHRMGERVYDQPMIPADPALFDDIVTGALARRDEIDAHIAAHLGEDWSFDRLDRPMRQMFRAGAYELLARPDFPVGVIIRDYLDVAHSFYGKKETRFVNGVLDAIAQSVRTKG